MTNNPLKPILEKEMDRKEFLQYIGIGLLGAVGVTAVIKNLEQLFSGSKRGAGYGGNPYGK